jgi:hypothetical protein
MLVWSINEAMSEKRVMRLFREKRKIKIILCDLIFFDDRKHKKFLFL